MSTRQAALDILTRVERDSAWASPLIDAVAGDERDRRFIRTLVMGVLRWRSRLDYVIESLAGRPVNRIDAPFRQILRLGLTQLMFTDVAPHAAVNETVSLCSGRLGRGRGLVNAVLRRATRENLHEIRPDGDTAGAVAVRTGHPEWLIARWIGSFGLVRTQAIAEANQKLSYADVLVNTRRTGVDELSASLAAGGDAPVSSPWFGDVLRSVDSTPALGEAIGEGLAWAMDEGSVAVARSFSSLEGASVLDLAAAPGGKSLVMTLDGADVVSHDVSIQRLSTLRTSFARMYGKRAALVVGDGVRPGFRGSFDRVLLDAPCSATGIIRRSPEIRWRLEEKNIAEFASLQRSLLAQALTLATRETVYSTCSLEREENDDVVAACLATSPEWRLAPVEPRSEELRRWMDGLVLRITPESGADGFTIHRLVRS